MVAELTQITWLIYVNFELKKVGMWRTFWRFDTVRDGHPPLFIGVNHANRSCNSIYDDGMTILTKYES